MKKIGLMLFSFAMLLMVGANNSQAAYLSEHDKYVEVSYEEARYIADLMGFEDVELGEETANLSFELQENLIAKVEKIIGKEIDHYYIWLTVDGKPVLGIDPPVPLYN